MNSFNQTIIRHKVGLLNLSSELGNISKTCKGMGVSRDPFYRYHHAQEEGGVDALIESSRRKPNLKNRVDEAIEAAVVAYALKQPAHGQLRTSNELRQRGVFSPLRFVIHLAAPLTGQLQTAAVKPGS